MEDSDAVYVKNVEDKTVLQINKNTYIMLRHGFLIIAHSYLDHLGKIIDVLSSPNHFFFINIDKKDVDGDAFMKKYADRENVFFLSGDERMEVAHGGYTLVECTMRLLRMAMKNGMDYCHLISGQDFPCVGNECFDKFFVEHNGYSYMYMDSEECRKEYIKKKYPSRVKPWFFNDIPNRNIHLVDLLVRGLNFVSRRVKWRSDIPNLCGGWQWFSWHRSVTEFVLNEEEHNPSFFKRFHHTSCSDELIFFTLLYDSMEKLNIISDNSLRYINWEKVIPGRKKKHSPLTLNEEEYDEIVESGALFCRKVHPVISEKLIALLEKRMKEQ